MKRRRLTDDELIWAAYLTVPAENRLAATYDDLTVQARTIWLALGKQWLAGGWNPPEREA